MASCIYRRSDRIGIEIGLERSIKRLAIGVWRLPDRSKAKQTDFGPALDAVIYANGQV